MRLINIIVGREWNKIKTDCADPLSYFFKNVVVYVRKNLKIVVFSAIMPVSRLDIYYRRMLLSKFFTKGWGDPDRMIRLLEFRKIISERATCYKLVEKDHSIEVLSQETWNNCYVTNGKFKSPFAVHLPDIVHEEVKDAYFQMIVPKKWRRDPYRPVCIHLAGTGDHYFWKRRHLMAKPLLKEGIGSIILENPFYGYRKPKEQVRSCLFNVSDIFVMGGCLILECIALFHWCERMGYGPLGVTGLSMGGHMASLAATSWPKPLVLVPCLSWSTASSVFTEGVMSHAINWDHLQRQYFSNNKYCDVLAKLCKIVDDPCSCGLAQIPEFNILMQMVSKQRKRELCNITPYELVSHSQNMSYPNHQNRATQSMLVSMDAITRAFNSSIRNILTVISNNLESIKVRDKEAVWFMRGLMDECTHLKNFDVPVDTSLIIAIAAQMDAYVPKKGIASLEDIWPNATVRYIDCGHVGAYLHHLNLYRESITEAFERAMTKLNPPTDN